jgi:hypothetical protein
VQGMRVFQPATIVAVPQLQGLGNTAAVHERSLRLRVAAKHADTLSFVSFHSEFRTFESGFPGLHALSSAMNLSHSRARHGQSSI